jgi:beta-glucosidase
MEVPEGFVLGVATAAAQIEGAADEDGKGPSIWDTFARIPGAVLGGDTPDAACDHYHRWRSDLDLLGSLGADAYRFSISWPRWQPGGSGPTNAAGVAFYDALIDGLLERGIQPWATLYHWDLPRELEDAGGWAARDTAQRFAEYAASVGDVLGDRLAGIATLNEPWCSAFLGYAGGVHAPGAMDDARSIAAVHHLLLGHGLAVDALRARAPQAQLGIVLNVYPVEPFTDAEADVDAARRIDGIANRIFLDPLLRGAYPDDVVADLADVSDFSHVRDGDLEVISRPLDFLGENYYSPYVVRGPSDDVDEASRRAGDHAGGSTRTTRSPWPGARDVVFADRGRPRTEMGWEVEPAGLRRVLDRLAAYGAPALYVTENGAAYEDTVAADGAVHDDDRTAYVRDHLATAVQARADGLDVRGYFLWSFLDNFEWSWGYSRRFGVVRVDYETQQRTPKDSARWYAGVARTREL